MTHRAVITLATMRRAIKMIEETDNKISVEIKPDGSVIIAPVNQKQIDYPKELDF